MGFSFSTQLFVENYHDCINMTLCKPKCYANKINQQVTSELNYSLLLFIQWPSRIQTKVV